jgi:hypothetical protein
VALRALDVLVLGVEVLLEPVVGLALLGRQRTALGLRGVHDLLHLLPDVVPLLDELRCGGHADFLS